jgi:hypothetical protein
MPGRLIQTTIDQAVLRKLDALAKVRGHRRASYLRHLVELHVQTLTPALLRITRKTSPLDVVGTTDEIADAEVSKNMKVRRR